MVVDRGRRCPHEHVRPGSIYAAGLTGDLVAWSSTVYLNWMAARWGPRLYSDILTLWWCEPTLYSVRVHSLWRR